MLKSVRYAALRSLMRNVHWLHALAAATIIVSSGPSSSRDAKSTAYETDMVESLRASGSFTLNTDVNDDSVRSRRNSPGEANDFIGKKATSSAAPTAMTAQTNSLAGTGRLFIASAAPDSLRAIGSSHSGSHARLEIAAA